MLLGPGRYGSALSHGTVPRVTREALWQSLKAGTASHVPVERASRWAVLPVTPQSVPGGTFPPLPASDFARNWDLLAP